MSAKYPAAVIIPHHNDPIRLGVCLEALSAQVPGRPVEVVVVDNRSDEDPASIVARHPWARLVREPEKGAAVARNRGVAETTAPRLIFLDADCVPAPDWLDCALALDLGNEVVGGRIDVFDETPPPRSGAEAFETAFAFAQRDYIEKKGFSVTANLVTNRAVFEAAGPFSNGLSEDLEWCQRAGRTGFPIRYEHGLRVLHPTRSTWDALRRKWARLTREAFATDVDGNAASRLRWLGRAGIVLASGIAHQPRLFRHPDLAFREKMRGSWTLLRLRVLRALWMVRQALGLGGPA